MTYFRAAPDVTSRFALTPQPLVPGQFYDTTHSCKFTVTHKLQTDSRSVNGNGNRRSTYEVWRVCRSCWRHRHNSQSFVSGRSTETVLTQTSVNFVFLTLTQPLPKMTRLSEGAIEVKITFMSNKLKQNIEIKQG